MKNTFLILLPALYILIGCGKNDENLNPLSEKSDFYPIDFCIVSGSTLDEEGSGMVSYTHIHDGMKIKFCCKPCLPKFQKDPDKFLVILEEEIKALKQENAPES
jgi:hypothetical protein